MCADLQLCDGLQGSPEDHDAGGHHRLRSGPLPSRPAGGVHGQARLPLEAAGSCLSRPHVVGTYMCLRSHSSVDRNSKGVRSECVEHDEHMGRIRAVLQEKSVSVNISTHFYCDL